MSSVDSLARVLASRDALIATQRDALVQLASCVDSALAAGPDTVIRVAAAAGEDHTFRNVVAGAAIGFVGALLTQAFQRWSQRRALRRSLIKAVKSDMLYTVRVLKDLAAQARDPAGFQMQLLAMMDTFAGHYYEYRRDLATFHERVRVRLHLLFTQLHAWREVQKLIEQRIDAFHAGNGTGVPSDEIDSMKAMAAPLHSLAEHALAAVVKDYDSIFRFSRPELDDDPGPPGYPRESV